MCITSAIEMYSESPTRRCQGQLVPAGDRPGRRSLEKLSLTHFAVPLRHQLAFQAFALPAAAVVCHGMSWISFEPKHRRRVAPYPMNCWERAISLFECCTAPACLRRFSPHQEKPAYHERNPPSQRRRSDASREAPNAGTIASFATRVAPTHRHANSEAGTQLNARAGLGPGMRRDDDLIIGLVPPYVD